MLNVKSKIEPSHHLQREFNIRHPALGGGMNAG